MTIDHDTMISAGRLERICRFGLFPLFLAGVSCLASVPDAVSVEKASLPEVRMKPRKLALFKNGYGTVTMEGKMAEGEAMELTGLPSPSYGSFWLSAEQGVLVRDLVSSRVNVKVPKTDYGKGDFLRANAGKLVRVTTDKGAVIAGRVVAPGNNRALEGLRPNMMDAMSSPVEDADSGYRSPSALEKGILLQTETGYVLLQEYTLQQIEILDKDIAFPTWSAERTRLVLNLARPAPGKTITVNSLSSGISWLPTYRVELGGEGKGYLQCKATIMNELMDLDKVDMELISGFPSLQMPGLPSPLSMKQNMSALFAALGSDRPGMEYVRSLVTSNGLMSQMRTERPVFNMEEATAIDPEKIRQAEDLFFYSIPGFSCKYKERVTKNLFDGNIPYSHVYTWDVPNQKTLAEWNQSQPRGEAAASPLDVWHCIRLTNSLNVPWSTGMVEFVSQGRLAGQSALTFTNPGEHVLVRLNKSMETMVSLSEETLSSEQVEHKGRSRQKYTVEGTLTMKNISGSAMDMRVSKAVIGTPSAVSDDGEMASLPNWQRVMNPDGKFQWKITLKPGEEKKLTYQYTYLE